MATFRPGPDGSDNSITALLSELSEGNREVEARLVPQIYEELRRVAGHYMRQERANQWRGGLPCCVETPRQREHDDGPGE